MMKKTKYILLIISIFLFATNTVKAESCDTQDIERLKQIAENVKVTYKHKKPYQEIDELGEKDYVYNAYNVSISGLTEETYVLEPNYENTYKFSDMKSNTVEDVYYSSNLTFEVYSTKCNQKLNTIKVNLPSYNYYSKTFKCLRTNNLNVCDEWYQGDLSEDTFNENIDKYLSEHKISQIWYLIINVFKNYIYYSIGAITLIIIVIVTLLLIKRKRGKLL